MAVWSSDHHLTSTHICARQREKGVLTNDTGLFFEPVSGSQRPGDSFLGRAECEQPKVRIIIIFEGRGYSERNVLPLRPVYKYILGIVG